MKSHICNDVWWNILPFFDHFQLGLKLALLSFRFHWLVDKHFNCKKEFTIWRTIEVKKDKRTEEAKLFVVEQGRYMDYAYDKLTLVGSPLPKHPLQNKIRFKRLVISYIDHSMIAFFHTNKQIFDKGTKLYLFLATFAEPTESMQFWDVFDQEILPFFAESIIHLYITDYDLNALRCRISPTILSDLKLLNSINSNYLLPDAIADDGPNATGAQALSKWLHTPTTDGKPKQLWCNDCDGPIGKEWFTSFKKAFLRATVSACYIIKIDSAEETVPVEPFELENEQTQEKLTLTIESDGTTIYHQWVLKRCPIGKTIQLKGETLGDFNRVSFLFANNFIGPMSPPAMDQSNETSSDQCPGPSNQ